MMPFELNCVLGKRFPKHILSYYGLFVNVLLNDLPRLFPSARGGAAQGFAWRNAAGRPDIYQFGPRLTAFESSLFCQIGISPSSVAWVTKVGESRNVSGPRMPPVL